MGQCTGITLQMAGAVRYIIAILIVCNNLIATCITNYSIITGTIKLLNLLLLQGVCCTIKARKIGKSELESAEKSPESTMTHLRYLIIN